MVLISNFVVQMITLTSMHNKISDWNEDLQKEIKQKTRSLGKVCITGKLANFTNRTQAKTCLEKLGYTVVNTVTKTLDYLVEEQNSYSSKTTKARSFQIPITTMQQLIEAAGE